MAMLQHPMKWSKTICLFFLAASIALGTPGGAEATNKAKHSSKAKSSATNSMKASGTKKKKKRHGETIYNIDIYRSTGGKYRYFASFKDKAAAQRSANIIKKKGKGHGIVDAKVVK